MSDGAKKLLAGGAAIYLIGSLMVTLGLMFVVGLLVWAFVL